MEYKHAGIITQGGDGSKCSRECNSSEGVDCHASEDICNLCERDVVDEDKALNCEWCEGWQHRKCLKMSEKKYDVLCETGGSVKFYRCNHRSKNGGIHGGREGETEKEKTPDVLYSKRVDVQGG